MKKLLLILIVIISFVFFTQIFVEAGTLEGFLKGFVGKEIIHAGVGKEGFLPPLFTTYILKEVGVDYMVLVLKVPPGTDSEILNQIAKTTRTIIPFHSIQFVYEQEGKLMFDYFR